MTFEIGTNFERQGMTQPQTVELAERIDAAISTALSVTGVTASAAEINVLDGSTATNQDLKDVHTNIARIKELSTIQIDGIVASNNMTEIVKELATRLMAIET